MTLSTCPLLGAKEAPVLTFEREKARLKLKGDRERPSRSARATAARKIRCKASLCWCPYLWAGSRSGHASYQRVITGLDKKTDASSAQWFPNHPHLRSPVPQRAAHYESQIT